MGNYSRIHVQLWSDDKFLALSAPPPNAQTLWLYLLTGPHVGQVPGLFTAGKASMAEALNWATEAFGYAFEEVLGKGLAKYDERARVVWIPNAVIYNPPQAPNVVVSWRYGFDGIPESPLKHEAFARIKAYLMAFGKPFRKPFDVPLGKPYGKGSSLSSSTLSSSEREESEERKLPRAKRLWPNDFALTEARRDVAKTHGVPEDWIEHVWTEWETACRSKGFAYVDWDKAWVNNCLRAVERCPWGRGGVRPKPPAIPPCTQSVRDGTRLKPCGAPSDPRAVKAGLKACSACLPALLQHLERIGKPVTL